MIKIKDQDQNDLKNVDMHFILIFAISAHFATWSLRVRVRDDQSNNFVIIVASV